MSLLKQFQNTDKVALTQKFSDLTHSIQSAFEGRVGGWGREGRFEFILNGLCSVDARLDLAKGTITIGISADKILSYDDGDSVEIRDADGRKNGYDAKKLKALVSKRIALDSKKWELDLQQYARVYFKQTVTELSNDVLSDLVKLMERSGFVPRVEARERYF